MGQSSALRHSCLVSAALDTKRQVLTVVRCLLVNELEFLAGVFESANPPSTVRTACQRLISMLQAVEEEETNASAHCRHMTCWCLMKAGAFALFFYDQWMLAVGNILYPEWAAPLCPPLPIGAAYDRLLLDNCLRSSYSQAKSTEAQCCHLTQTPIAVQTFSCSLNSDQYLNNGRFCECINS